MITLEVFNPTVIDNNILTNNVYSLLNNIKLTLIIVFIIVIGINIVNINYVRKTKKLLNKAIDTYGEDKVTEFFNTIPYHMSDTSKQVYESLVEYIDKLKESV